MTSSEVEMGFEEQYSKNESHVASHCREANRTTTDETSALEESSTSLSAIKKWEIVPLFQTFKSKMASFTEIVMSPVRLFKPSGPLFSAELSENHELITDGSESETQSSSRNETLIGPDCKNGLSTIKPSESTDSSSNRKHKKVAQRLNFCTISSNNLKSELDHTNPNNDVKLNLEIKKNRPSQPQHLHQDQSSQSRPLLRTSPFPSLDTHLHNFQSTKDPSTSEATSAIGFQDIGSNGFTITEPCSLSSGRRIPRKKHRSANGETSTTEQATCLMESNTLNGSMKEPESRNGVEWSECSIDPSHPTKCSSVADVKMKRHRAPKKDHLTKRKCALLSTEDGEPRPVKKTRSVIPEKLDSAESQGSDDLSQLSSVSMEISRASSKTKRTRLRSKIKVPLVPVGPSEPMKSTAAVEHTGLSLLDARGETIPSAKLQPKMQRRRRSKHLSVGGHKRCFDEVEESVPDVLVSGSGSRRLLRSVSCPDIPSLWCGHAPVSHKQTSPAPLTTPLHSPSKRTRRHTVCSVEMEREVAPLCLRKEVYPPLSSSPSTSLKELTTCFLSSPLAFLSKSSAHAHADAHPGTSVTPAASSPSQTLPGHAFTPLTPCLALSGPPVVTPRHPEFPAPVLSLSSHEVLEMECEAVEQSTFRMLSAALSEEKALSDSEVKTDLKDGHRGKVSSIRIRKQIPKPQNNLTPMGLPKVVRTKKKEFSLEEIYTNKNFSKPPDGRLETIFETPLHRRDGSQSLTGQKKMKRFVEFPELGVPRRPKKPLVGQTAALGPRKAAGNRTRRALGASSKAEDSLDALLCSKLQELDIWATLQGFSD